MTFRLDMAAERLWRENEAVALSPKSLAVLAYLVERAGHLVPRAELLAQVWPGVHVTDAAVRYSVRQVRKVFDDSVAGPKYVETVPRRGWRFIGRAARTGPQAWLLEPRGTAVAAPAPPSVVDREIFVGRAAESTALMEALARAHGGARQLTLISGEAGIGKTSLIEAFFRRLAGAAEVVCAQGQCVAHYGEGEAYRPILELVERLCERLGGSAPAAILRRHAPMWLAQLPSLTDPAERVLLHEQLAGATQGRMLRELARAFEELDPARTIVLWIDDLQWADASTLALLDLIARRREPVRLLVLGTYRPPESDAGESPLRTMQRDLEVHGHCRHLPLGLLDRETVDAYVGRRFDDGEWASVDHALGRFLHERTEGNPLFMVSVAADLVARGVVAQHAGRWRIAAPLEAVEAPATVTQLLVRDLERLEPGDRELLQVASLAGMEFSAAAVAAGVGGTVEDVEAHCGVLARAGRFLVARGGVTWPDGTVASGFAFVHALHREVLAADVTAARRARLHGEIGRRKERAYGDRTGDSAAELARHFDEGRDPARAVHYLALAGDAAARRYANREATTHLRRALQLLDELPATEERDGRELMLRLALAVPLAAIEGYAAPDLEANLLRIEHLARVFDESPEFFPVLLGLWSLHIVRANLPTACDIGSRLLRMAEAAAEPVALLQAHRMLGHGLFYRGDLREAHRHFARALAGYDVAAHRRLDYAFGDDPVVLCRSYAAWALWFLGQPEQAVRMIEEAIAVGEALAHPPSLAFAMSYAAILQQLRRDPAQAAAQAEAVMRLAREEGFALWLALATIVHGWVLAEQGDVDRGVATMNEGLTAWTSTGADLGRPYFLCMVGEAYGRVQRVEPGLELVAEADRLIARTGQHMFAAERLRVEGELLIAAAARAGARRRRDAVFHAEARFRHAIAIARQQGALALELRAAMSLARTLHTAEDGADARLELARVYDELTEGFEDRDARAAKALLV